MNDNAMDLLASLLIDKTQPRKSANGTWVTGTIGGHRFEALVFQGRAECEGYELDGSRISKLHLQRMDDRSEVACFDRGWDREPTTPLARQLVDLLAAGLAESIFDK